MCGIVGVVAGRSSVPILMEGLRRLEYRGYDSAGIAVLDGGRVTRLRTVGKVRILQDALDADPIGGHVGIANSLLRTNPTPIILNPHPHISAQGPEGSGLQLHLGNRHRSARSPGAQCSWPILSFFPRGAQDDRRTAGRL